MKIREAKYRKIDINNRNKRVKLGLKAWGNWQAMSREITEPKEQLYITNNIFERINKVEKTIIFFYTESDLKSLFNGSIPPAFEPIQIEATEDKIIITKMNKNLEPKKPKIRTEPYNVYG